MQELNAEYCNKHNEWFFLPSWKKEGELIYKCQKCRMENEKYNLYGITMRTREEVRSIKNG